MAIQFLKDYSVGSPAEDFAKDEVVKDRSPESEAHFVRRGVAAYLGDKGELTDIDGKPLKTPELKTAPEAPPKRGAPEGVLTSAALGKAKA